MKRGQTGFTVVETLLVLILVAILGFTGYYVYHSQKNSNTSYNNAANANKDVAQSANSSNGSSGTITFANLGVKISWSLDDQTGMLKDLTQSPNPQYPDTSDNVSTPGYASSAKSCDPKDTGNFGLVGKQNGTYDPNSDLLINLKQFNGFWISYTPALGNPCEGQAGADQLATVKDDLKASLVKAFQTATEVK